MISSASLIDLGFRVLNVVHRGIAHATGDRVVGSVLGRRFIELHTVGRRTGRPHSAMLLAPVVDGDRVVLVASKGGDDRDPDWYRNLLAHPDAELTMDGRRRPVRTRTASPAEKAELWPRVVAAYRGYASYQRRSSRDIPLVICEPRLPA